MPSFGIFGNASFNLGFVALLASLMFVAGSALRAVSMAPGVRRELLRGSAILLGVMAAATESAGAVGVDNDALAIVASAPLSELPARVAEAVRRAPEEAAEIACDLLAVRPTAARTIARAASAAVPEAAAQITLCAVEIDSEGAAAIAAAVASAVPSQSAAIVEAACRSAPEIAGNIADAVARAVPAQAEAARAAAAAVMARWVPATIDTRPPPEEPPPAKP